MVPARSRTYAAEDGSLSLSSEAFRDILLMVLARGESVRFKAGGLSMFPSIQDGDVVTVSPIPPHEARPGDIAAVLRPLDDGILVHRVVRHCDGGIVTKGDAAFGADGFIPFDAVLGRVSSVERDGRRVGMGFAAKRHAMALLSRHGWLIPLTTRFRSLRAMRKRLT